MNLLEKATIIHFHRHRIANYNHGTVKALGWKGEESQRKRFEVLSQVADLNNSSILDVGCGYGDLKTFLDLKFSNYTYIGIDLVSEFINEAKTLHAGATDTHFLQADFATAKLPEVDYILASGAVGYKCIDPDYYFLMIKKMYNAASKAFAFNMLDKAFFPEHPLLTGHNFEKVVSFCKTLSPRVASFSGYLYDDFTVFMYHE